MRTSLEPRVLWSSCLVALVVVVPNSVHGQLGPCIGKIGYTDIEGFGVARSLAVSNHRMVTSDGPTVSSWRLGDPDSPEFLGRWTTWDEENLSEYPMQIDERGFAFVGYERSPNLPWFSIRIWDLREGREPRPVAVLPGSWVDFFVDGDLLVGVGIHDLTVVDIGDPYEAEVVCTSCGGIDLGNGPPSYGFEPLRIGPFGDQAVILDFDELLVVDYSEPVSSSVVSTIPLDYPFTVVGTDTRLWTNGTVAVAAPTIVGGTVIVDLSDIATPGLFSWPVDPADSYWGVFHDNTWIFHDWNSPGEGRRLDLSDPSAPVELSPIVFGDWPNDAAVWNDRLYVAEYDTLRIYDLSGEPTLVGAGPVDRSADHMAVAGGVGLAAGRDHLFTYDLDAPDGPVEMAGLELDWWPRAPATDGVMGAAFSYGEGVVLVDLQDLGAPVFLDTIPVQGTWVTELEIGGGLLAVASRDDGNGGWLELWQVSLAAPPVFLSLIGPNEPVWQIETVGDRIFLGLGGHIAEVDISNPASPVMGAPLDLDHLDGSIDKLAATGTELFASDYASVAVVDISTPGAPIERQVVNHLYGGLDWLASHGETVVLGSGCWLYAMGVPDAGGVLPVVDVQGPPYWGGYTSGISDNVLYVAGRFRVISVDLSCTPPSADFIWYSMDRKIRFIDRTTFDNDEDDRMWEWTVAGDPRIFYSRSPLVEFDGYGTYQVTMNVTTETGTVSTTKTVEVAPNPGRALIFVDGFEFRNTAAWTATAPE